MHTCTILLCKQERQKELDSVWLQISSAWGVQGKKKKEEMGLKPWCFVQKYSSLNKG